MKKRILSILLTIVMVIVMLPTAALAADATETADFTTDAEAALALLNAAKTEGAANSEWDPATSTLTLKGVDFTTSAAIAVRLPDGATIVLADGTENTIANVHGLISHSVGIQANGNITIQGSGTLTVTAGTAAQISCGIYADGNVTISGGTVTATGGETTQDTRGSNGIFAAGVTISGGTVTATGGKAATNSCGIYAYTNVTITGGTVTATGGNATGDASESFGLYGSGYFENNEVIGGNVTIKGGTVTATGGEAEYSSGIYADAGDITISGGTVTATGGEAEYSSGIDADGVTISGGTVTATGGKAATNSRGIDAYTNVTISGGTVTATGGETTHDSWGSNGIDADGVTISGGTVTATGGKAAANSCGIYAYTNVTITGGTLTVTAGTAEQISCGIYGYTNVTITGGTVTATGGEAEYSCGIDSDGVTISGGTVTATGGKAATNSYGIYAINNVTISGGHVTAQTVSTTATTESALNVAPDLSSYTGYRWRTSASGDFTSSADTAYTYRESDTYVEFSQGAAPTTYTVRFDANGGSGEMTDVTDVSGSYTLPTTTTFTAPSGKQFAGWATSASGTVIIDTTITVTEDTTLYAVWATDYGVTVNGEKVTSLNKDNVLGNDTVRYDPATNTLYAENLYAASLNVVGNGSTDVVISSTSSAPAVGALTVTGAKDVTVTANSGAPALYGEANITCTGNVTITNSNGMAVSSPLTVTGATDVTVEGSGVPAIAGNTMITCTGNVTIANSNGMAVSSPLTVTGAKNVTITANSSSAPAIGGNANITCSGDVTISNTGGGKAVAGNLTYQNASGKHSYTVKTGDSLENLTDYATKEAGDTFTATLDAAAVKITVAHVLTYVEAKAATCTEDGNLEHWACTLSCGKLFLDENGTTETTLEAVTIKAGHTADEWHSDSTQHWQVCTVCGEEFNRANHTFIGNTCTVCGYTKPSGGGSVTPEVTETPEIIYDEETFTVTAIGNGIVKLYKDGEEVSNPCVLTQTDAETTYTFTATAQEAGKTISETATLSVTVPAGGSVTPEVTETPTITYDEETLTVTATGAGIVILYVDGVVVENPYTFEQGEEDVTYIVTATAQEEGKEISETAILEVTVPAKEAEPAQKYTITYTDGVDGKEIFVDFVFTDVEEGSATPTISNPTRSGYTFTGWTPAVAATVTGNQTYTATWDKNSTGGGIVIPTVFPVTVKESDNGEVEASAKYAVPGSTVKLTVTPDEGYELDTLIVKSGSKFINVTEKNGKYQFVMPFGSATVTATFKAVNPYNDVDTDDWFYDDVLYVTLKDLMNGTGDGKFSPEITTDRAMLVTVLWRLEGCPVVDSSVAFDDVADGLWYSDAIDWASANGIVNGYGDGKFGPTDQITREQIAAILNRYAAYKNWTDGTALPMIPQYNCSIWAENNVIWADMNGLLNGLGVDITDMTAKASRAELAAYLARFMQNIVK